MKKIILIILAVPILLFAEQNKFYPIARKIYKTPSPFGEIFSVPFTILGNISEKNRYSEPSIKEYSKLKAMVFSAILPGSGELYAKNYKKAAVFFCAEATIIFSYLRLKNETNWAVNSYQQFAFSNAEVPLSSDDDYYQQIQDYESSDAYNENIILAARNYFLIYKNDPEGYEDYLQENLIPQDQEWDWETNRNWIRYKKMRHDKQNLEIYTNFTFAAAILNRIISFVDAAITAKKHNNSVSEIGSFHIDPDWQKKGMKIYYEYKF